MREIKVGKKYRFEEVEEEKDTKDLEKTKWNKWFRI